MSQPQKHSDKAVAHSLPDGLHEIKSLKKPQVEPEDKVVLQEIGEDITTAIEDPNNNAPAVMTVAGDVVVTTPEQLKALDAEEEEETYVPSKIDRIAQRLEDALIQAFKLDPTGESYSVVVAVTTTQGKIFTVKADSTDDERFKDTEFWGRAYVEAEVTKTLTAFDQKEQARQQSKVLKKSAV